MRVLVAPISRLDRSQAVVLLILRLSIAPLYLYSGIGKLTHFAITAARMSPDNITLGYLLTTAAICAEVGGGLFLVLGLWDRLTACGMIVFTVVATLIFHQFWAAAPAQVVMQSLNFLKNVGLVGGLLVVATFGAGPFALGAPRRYAL